MTNPPDDKPYKLTDQQMNFFKTFGYLSFPGLMADRIDEIIREFESVWEAHGGGHNGKPHDEKARSCLVPFIDQSELLCSLLDDPRILGIAKSLLGDDFNYTGSDGNYYVGDTGWHSDGQHKETLFIKIAFYLDPLTRNSGALRVIPGSHIIGDRYAAWLQEQIRQSRELWGLAGSEKMVRTATPERIKHLEQVMANDRHLSELSKQARQRMSEPSRG